MTTAEHIKEKVANLRRTLGMYRLMRIISEGATGVVLEAEHWTLGRRVALKTFNPRGFERSGMLVAELTEVFLHEARILGAIDHPNVITIYDAGFARGSEMSVEIPYLALRLVGNGDLCTFIQQRGRLDGDAALRVLAGCAHGLRAIHVAGFLHRDLKPANILIEVDGTPRIADLSAASPKGLPPRPGRVVGTCGYLAPEHVLHGASNVATDLYSLGATLYYALTGKPPYQVEVSDLVTWAENATAAPAPHLENSAVDPRLSQVIMRLLAPNPQQRYGSVDEVVEDADSLLAGRSPAHAARSRTGFFWR